MHSPSVDIKRLARMAAKVAPVTTDADMYDHLVSLLSSDAGLRVDNDPTAPLPWAVWLDDEIVGAGDSRTEALKDALLTAAGWAL